MVARQMHAGCAAPSSSLLSAFLFAIGLLCLAAPAAAARTVHHARHPAPHRTTAHRRLGTGLAAAPGQASFLMDSETGTILEQSNADTPLHPASLTKTMTLLLTFEAIQGGRVHIRDSVPISAHAAGMPPSKLGLRPGSSIAVEDAIYALVTHSCNDIAVALAEKIGGNEPNFVAMMNRRAAQLGMAHTHFINANGLHNPVQFSSAHDMAILAHYIIQAHPDYYHYFNTRTFIYRGTVYQNHNHLMETYAGMDGLKTGFIQQSGFNLIASAHRDGHRLIGVIFGGRSTASRNAAMAVLLDWGFAHDDQLVAAARAARQTGVAAAAPAPPVLVSTLPLNQTAAGEDDDNVPPSAAAMAQGDNDPAGTSRPALPPRPLAAPAQMVQAAPARSPQTLGALSPAIAPSAAGAANGWGVQLGAFDTKEKGGAMLTAALGGLPPDLRSGRPTIVPLQTGAGWLYRARLTGYNRDQAFAACKLLADCVPVSPQPN